MANLKLQGEGTSSPVGLRARSRDSPSPSEELSSPLTRGKRTATRGRGQGDNSGPDGTASLQHPPKRLCLSSIGGPVRTNITADFTCCCFFTVLLCHTCIQDGAAKFIRFRHSLISYGNQIRACNILPHLH